MSHAENASPGDGALVSAGIEIMPRLTSQAATPPEFPFQFYPRPRGAFSNLQMEPSWAIQNDSLPPGTMKVKGTTKGQQMRGTIESVIAFAEYFIVDFLSDT